MGLYDTIHLPAKCPVCKTGIVPDFQTKDGLSAMHHFWKGKVFPTDKRLKSVVGLGECQSCARRPPECEFYSSTFHTAEIFLDEDGTINGKYRWRSKEWRRERTRERIGRPLVLGRSAAPRVRQRAS